MLFTFVNITAWNDSRFLCMFCVIFLFCFWQSVGVAVGQNVGTGSKWLKCTSHFQRCSISNHVSCLFSSNLTTRNGGLFCHHYVPGRSSPNFSLLIFECTHPPPLLGVRSFSVCRKQCIALIHHHIIPHLLGWSVRIAKIGELVSHRNSPSEQVSKPFCSGIIQIYSC